MSVLNPWYITGFCDGEAAFTYSRASGSFALYFGIKQRADNRQLVDGIREFFDYIGTIYYPAEPKDGLKSESSQGAIYYRVTKAAELKRIVEHFDKYPLQSPKKKKLYLIWRQMVKYKLDNFRNTDYTVLEGLAEEMSKLNSKSRNFKAHKKLN
ncbi:MAG: LAGLIDADG family homing endonuclease [Candidatus Omnitrophota bacterium]